MCTVYAKTRSDKMMASLHYNSYSNYYTLLFIPVGLAICALIKLLSDFTYANKAVVINTGEYGEETVLSMKSILQEKICMRQELNDRIFMIKGLPLLLCEVVLPNVLSRRQPEWIDNLKGYAAMLCDYYRIGVVHDGMLWCGDPDSSYEMFSARAAYDEFIKSGNLSGLSGGFAKLLKRNMKVV